MRIAWLTILAALTAMGVLSASAPVAARPALGTLWLEDPESQAAYFRVDSHDCSSRMFPSGSAT